MLQRLPFALLLGLSMLAPAASAGACKLAKFRQPDTGLYGYRDGQGRVAIAAQFRFAEAFNRKGLAVVSQGWLNCAGELFTPYLVDNTPDDFRNGPARYKLPLAEGYVVGYLHANGEVAVPAQYGGAGPFCDGYAQVGQECRQERMGEHSLVSCARHEVINGKGAVVTPPANWSDKRCDLLQRN